MSRSSGECRHEGAAGLDFCPHCHAYLAWDKPDEAPTTPLPDLGSDPEGSVAVATPPRTDAAQSGPPPRRAAISLREDEWTDHPIKTNAGDTVTLHVRVRNQSTIVDEFVLGVEGWLLPAWWEIQPPELYLLPFGTGHPSSCEGDATVKLHPPRNWRAIAGRHEIAITVTSTASGERLAALPLVLDVGAYPDVRLTVDPQCSIGRRRGSFNLTIENAGNDTVELELTGRDREGQCALGFTPQKLGLTPGQRGIAAVEARARPHLVGRPIEHMITLFALAPGATAPPPSKYVSLRDQALAEAGARGGKAARAELSKAKKAAQKLGASKLKEAGLGGASKLGKTLGLKLPAPAPAAAPGTAGPTENAAPAAVAAEDAAERTPSCTCTYRQKAWVPTWAVAAAVIIIALFLWALKSRVAVPNVKGQYITAARDAMKKAGLKGVEHTMVPSYWSLPPSKPGHARTSLKPGDVFAEVPHVNTKVCVGFPGDVFALIPYLGPKMCRTSSIELLTAVLPGSASVPNLFGLTPGPAEHLLSQHGFAIGDIQPYPPPKGEVIVEQSPRAGRRVKRTTVIDVKLGQAAAVPDLTGQTPAQAQQMLRPTGLILGQVRPKHAPPEAVIAAQSIAAGKTVQAGQELDVGLGMPVPKLKGTALAPATKKLAALGFKLGAVKPSQRPAGYVVARETPKAGAIAPLHASVALTLAAPPKKKQKQKKSTAQAPAGAAKPVPSVAGATAAAAAAAIAKTGAKTRTTYAISSKVPAGKLISTSPAAGSQVAKGKVVTLVVSAGYPEIAVDDGHRILALSGVNGKVLTKVVAGPQAATQPSWSPRGTDLAYISGGRIMLTAVKGPSGPIALTRGNTVFALPTFPSTPNAPAVLAAIGWAPGRGEELCLLTVAHPTASCLSVPGWILGGEITWSPQGTELLVGAGRSSGTFGLLKFTSHTPFSTRARAWRRDGLVTPAVGGTGVRAAAFSPDGTRLALAEDLGGPFSLALVAPSDLMLAKADTFVAPTPACSVQWRTDSQLVLVQTSSAPGCSAGLGSVYVVEPAHPRALSLIATGVADAVWQPLPGIG